MSSPVIPILVSALSTFLSIYLVLLIIRILLSWFPNIDWSNPAFSALSQLTDPYLNIFRSIIPPLGGIDFSPIIGFIVLQLLMGALNRVAVLASASSFYYSSSL
ncbi:YggT family protein [Romeria aff. gracilis LEGE 07310]|uniref:YggT family protein n=1 Tax=Vasconcelosia minhoensis LEGE 07310 TaxID=915328 RepID=A0A8J7DQQ1_9CYAN|nr:YggT family protein [Romeria gracilis]MBE9076924.1 YggT family protein [Romeria aff. gracilis LEGE 07310]